MMFNAIGITKEESSKIKDFNTPAHCLRLLGRSLNLTARLYAKKFRSHGYKKGALTAFQELESAGLGTMKTIKNKGFVIVTILMGIYMYHKLVFVLGQKCIYYSLLITVIFFFYRGLHIG